MMRWLVFLIDATMVLMSRGRIELRPVSTNSDKRRQRDSPEVDDLSLDALVLLESLSGLEALRDGL